MNFSGSIIPHTTCTNQALGFGSFFQVIQTLLSFAVYLAVFFAVLMIAYAGFLFVTNPANPDNVKKGREVIMQAVIGLLVVLGAWLLVNTVLAAFGTGSFSSVGGATGIFSGGDPCVKQIAGNAPPAATVPATPGVAPAPSTTSATPGATMSTAGISDAAAQAKKYGSQLCADAQADGLSSSAANQLAGVLGVESDGNPNATSGVGAVGLMQLEPGTAKQLDPSLSGLSNDQITAKLKDPTYNIGLGTKYYSQLYNQFGGNVNYATAAYNAGSGSGVNSDGTKQPFAASSDCPGEYAWQCPINPGGFAETQNYVGNVAAVTSAAGSVCSY